MQLLVFNLVVATAIGGRCEGVTISSTVLGQGTYGMVYAATSDEGRELAAKTHRADSLSRKYFDVEKKINERVAQFCPDESLYVGDVEDGPWFARKQYLLFDRVPGGRDLGSYLADGAAGLESLAAALGVEAFCADMEECVLDDLDSTPRSDPDVSRSGGGNAYVAAVVLELTLSAVASLQAAGICHRDVKPSNLLVDPIAKKLRLIDFGSGLDVEKKTGMNARRSPVSPRYCPPEKFVELDNWRSFDSYSAGITALRLLLSPSLRSDNDLDAFNVEFQSAECRLDSWLGSKMTEKAVPTKLLAPLSALKSSSPDWDRAANGLWRLVARLTELDPSSRLDVQSGAQAASDARRKLELAERPTSTTEPASSPTSSSSSHHDDTMTRCTLAAPAGLDIEDTDEGVVVTRVKPGGSADKLGIPKVGDRLVVFEWKEAAAEITDVDSATSSMRKITPGALMEIGVVESGPTTASSRASASSEKSSSSRWEVGMYRRRGKRRSAVQDSVAVFGSSFVDRLDAKDWPSRPTANEISEARRVALGGDEDGWAAALVADGHGAHEPSIHIAQRVPDLVRDLLALPDREKPSLDSALLAAWTRCAAEFTVSDEMGGSTCAMVAADGNECAILHCGDSRVVASSIEAGNVLYETRDHTLRDSAEVEALVKRGAALDKGRVAVRDWRVSIPRALGGRPWQEAGIASVPDVGVVRDDRVDVVVVASDGLFDEFSSREAALYVKSRLIFRSHEDVSQIAMHLCERAAALGSSDDISAAVLVRR